MAPRRKAPKRKYPTRRPAKRRSTSRRTAGKSLWSKINPAAVMIAMIAGIGIYMSSGSTTMALVAAGGIFAVMVTDSLKLLSDVTIWSISASEHVSIVGIKGFFQWKIAQEFTKRLQIQQDGLTGRTQTQQDGRIVRVLGDNEKKRLTAQQKKLKSLPPWELPGGQMPTADYSGRYEDEDDDLDAAYTVR